MVSIDNLKVLHIFAKTLVVSIICGKCSSNNERMFKEKESTKIFKIIDLINLKIWEKNASLVLRFEKTDEQESMFRINKTSKINKLKSIKRLVRL